MSTRLRPAPRAAAPLPGGNHGRVGAVTAREMRSATRPPLPRLDLFRRRGQPTNWSVGAIGAMWRRNAGNHGILGEAIRANRTF